MKNNQSIKILYCHHVTDPVFDPLCVDRTTRSWSKKFQQLSSVAKHDGYHLCLFVPCVSTGLLFAAYALCLFLLYSLMPLVIMLTSATTVNLSLLTSDIFSFFFGVFLFHYTVSAALCCTEAIKRNLAFSSFWIYKKCNPFSWCKHK